MLKLNNSVSIYLMKQDNDNKSLKDLNNEIIKDLANAFGGCTTVNGTGYWNDNNTLYQDSNLIATCNYSELSTEMKISFMNAIKDEFIKGGQLAVSIELNHELFILESLDDLTELEKLF